MWIGLALGTALAALAMSDGVHLKIAGAPSFLGWILGGLIVWLLVVLAATAFAEVLRRHHRTIGRYAGRQATRAGRHGWRLARRHGGRGLNTASQWAGGRWEGRQAAPQDLVREPVDPGTALRPSRWRRGRRAAGGDGAFTDPNPTSPDGFPPVPGWRRGADGTLPSDVDDVAASPDGGTTPRPLHMPDESAGAEWGAPDPGAAYGTGPWMLAVRRRDGRPYYDAPFSPVVASAMVHDSPDLQRRLTAAAADPGLAVRVVPLKLTDPDLVTPLDPAIEAEIKRQACDEGAPDGIVPEEVIVGADGSVTIDRRLNPNGRYQQATPITGELRWSPFRGAARVYAVHPSRSVPPSPVPVPRDVEEAIRQRVCGLPWAMAEGLQPGDVTVGPYGAIFIDRSRAHPGQTAYDGLRWVPLPDGSVSIAATWQPAGSARHADGTLPSADSNTDHGGSNMTTAATENQPGYWPTHGGPGSQRRPSRIVAAPEANGTWRPLIGSTHDFEPENDSHLLGWMAGEAGGMTGYAEAIADAYETAVNTVGLDPVAMQALHDYADAAASAAEAMAAARQRFADHYSEVRAFAANGGVLPYNGRWMTGEGD